MADNKRWFKVWNTLLVDMIIEKIPLEEIGRFCVLGCLISSRGEKGHLPISEDMLKTFLKCEKLPEKFISTWHIGEGKSDNGTSTVTMKNWIKYQEDSTVYERVKKHRKSKSVTVIRGEEKRREEKRKRNTPLTPQGERFARFWSAYPKKKSKGQAEKAWLKLNPSEQLLETMLSNIKIAKTSTDWVREGGQYIPNPSTWLNAKGWEDEYQSEKDSPNDEKREMWKRDLRIAYDTLKMTEDVPEEAMTGKRKQRIKELKREIEELESNLQL